MFPGVSSSKVVGSPSLWCQPLSYAMVHSIFSGALGLVTHYNTRSMSHFDLTPPFSFELWSSTSLLGCACQKVTKGEQVWDSLGYILLRICPTCCWLGDEFSGRTFCGRYAWSVLFIQFFDFNSHMWCSKSLMDNQSLSSKHNDWECGSMSKGGGLLAEQALVCDDRVLALHWFSFHLVT